MITIVIPSYKRAGSVTALDTFPSDIIPHLIVRAEEFDAYNELYADRAKVVAIDGVKGIADTRRKITEIYAGQKILMIDDDTTIHKAVTVGNWRRAGKEKLDSDVHEMLEIIETAMSKGFSHGHIKYPVFPVSKDAPIFAENSYGFTNVWLDLTVLTPEQVGYGLIHLCEDTYTYLKLIREGINHLVLQNYMVRSGKGNAEGGVSTERNVENHNLSLEILVKEFPEYVKWNPRTSKLALEGEGQVKSITIRAGKRKKSDAFNEMVKLYDTSSD